MKYKHKGCINDSQKEGLCHLHWANKTGCISRFKPIVNEIGNIYMVIKCKDKALERGCKHQVYGYVVATGGDINQPNFIAKPNVKPVPKSS